MPLKRLFFDTKAIDFSHIRNLFCQKLCAFIKTSYLCPRHITAGDRIIYDIYDDRVSVLIIQAEEHYNDK